MPRPVCPPIAADVIAEIGSNIVLIERRNFPFGWAIPGGFVDVGETVEDAAVRELREETTLEVELRALLGVVGSNFEVVDESSLMVQPDSGQAVQ